MTKSLSKKFVPLIGILCMLSYHSLLLYFFSSELKQFPKAVKLEKTAAQVIRTEDGGSCIFFQVPRLSLFQYSELRRFTIWKYVKIFNIKIQDVPSSMLFRNLFICGLREYP